MRVFHVELNPKIAAPRQTDLFARFGTTDYVIEAKWQTDKIGIPDIDDVRLQRMPTDVLFRPELIGGPHIG